MEEGKKKKTKQIVIMAIICIVIAGAIIGTIAVMNNNKESQQTNEETNIKDEKTEFLNQAEILDLQKLNKEIEDNIVRAKEQYQNKIYIWTTTVTYIQEKYFKSNGIEVYLKNQEDLAKLDRNETVVIVGRLEIMSSNNMKFASAYIITDEQNLIWAPIEEKRSSTTRTYYDYKYNAENGLITEYKEKGNGYPGTYTMEYDDKGNMTKKLRKNYKDETELETYTYNEDNSINTMEITTSNPDNIENGKKFEYTYEKDDKNRIIKMTTVNTTRDNYTLVYSYVYDDTDKIIKETQTSPNTEYEITYKYDKNNVIEKRSRRIDKSEASSTQTYKYSVIGIKK